MRHNDVIYLMTSTITQDEYLNEIQSTVPRMVYANKMGVGQQEFYNALAQGLKPSKQFELYEFEYGGEAEFKYEDDLYKVTRTQEKGEKIRITGERV